MTKTVKILIGIVAGAGITALFAFHKKTQKAVKKIGKLIIGDSSTGTPGDAPLVKGSTDAQHVMQLQQVINELHTAYKYINATCGSVPLATYAGNLLPINGVFDNTTAAMCQFYLNRQEVDLDYLDLIRSKLAKYKAGSDKCKLPLSY